MWKEAVNVLFLIKKIAFICFMSREHKIIVLNWCSRLFLTYDTAVMFEEARNMGPIKSRQRTVTNWNMGDNEFEYEFCFVLSNMLPFSFYLILNDMLLLCGKITISTEKIIVVFLAAASKCWNNQGCAWKTAFGKFLAKKFLAKTWRVINKICSEIDCSDIRSLKTSLLRIHWEKFHKKY